MRDIVVGIIGGSGLYEIEGLKDVKEVKVRTPFGTPSDAYIMGNLGNVKMIFLPRHGKGHKLLPSELNYRANIFGMKKLGVEWIISVSAVGSMREAIQPGHVVVVDQFFDRTKNRDSTFFGDGIVGHVEFADPVCPELSDILYRAGKKVKTSIHKGGTYMCIEGPQFSTKAESRIYRKWGVDVIGMTNIPEAKLAREAEICYATLALSTDYDCWHEAEESVTVEMILDTLNRNVETAKSIIKEAIKLISDTRSCKCATAIKHAIITDRKTIPTKTKKKLEILFSKYF
ncbi:MAG: S-methyl-5'-thioadenosine phosphorylase [Thermodesulfobacteriota bacterium]